MRKMKRMFEGTRIKVIDGLLIGEPPSEKYNPGLYLSADPEDSAALDDLVGIATRFGEGSKCGDTSATKMTNSGIVKGAIGLFVSMILAANASSPATTDALVHSLCISQPAFLDQIARLIPDLMPKAYRFVGEFEEFAESVAGTECREVYEGMIKIFEKVAEAHENQEKDINVLIKFAAEAQRSWESNTGVTGEPEHDKSYLYSVLGGGEL
ncbi:hypothetical protein K435DRAFT_800874 [Dendrothele bispora CBS 962.96]|uniref:Phosphogluconate dehydrogenase NAD-binding putative C-terminal domain-containing protein n=1 Tax=Dendrothele bispora (strain CBS 962.96) TaxID=1314807 RepID=A0A4S8LSQ8_DENBC|nr:hypothetical protein K435DRAFT_800874 [Dendrothele bispora CBS 962.96]